MAINVAYKVPAALLQAERDKERRAFNRQLQLQRNQQNFQREQSDINYARSLENRQFNANRQDEQQQRLWDRQDELRDDQRQYQERQQKKMWGRQDWLRDEQRQYQEGQQQKLWDRQDEQSREQVELDAAKLQYVEQQMQAQAVETLRTQEWQQSIITRQQKEKQFSYSDMAKADLDRVRGQMRDLMANRDVLDPATFQQAMWDLRAQEAAIMPDQPIVRPSPEEQFDKNSFVKTLNGQDVIFYPDGKGGYKVEYGSQDAVKAYTAALEYATKGSTDKETGMVDQELFDRLYDDYINRSPQKVAERKKAEAEQRKEARRKALSRPSHAELNRRYREQQREQEQSKADNSKQTTPPPESGKEEQQQREKQKQASTRDQVISKLEKQDEKPFIEKAFQGGSPWTHFRF